MNYFVAITYRLAVQVPRASATDRAERLIALCVLSGGKHCGRHLFTLVLGL